MEAVAEVKRKQDEELDVPSIKRALEVSDVSYGVSEEECEALVKLVNERPAGGPVRIAVARGVPAVDGEDGTVRMVVEGERDSVGVEDDSGHIDFHERGSFTPIEKDQLIAELTLPTSGTPGKNVCGEELAAQTGERPSLTAGQGTTLAAGGTELRASRSGDLRSMDGRIEVTDLIRVPGNLDFDMGSIECEGSVRVEGDVLPEFHIRAEGDITIGGVVDAAEVTAGGDVVIRQGIVRGGRVTAKGSIKVGYVSNSYMESEGDVSILKEALHSTVLSANSITVPASGRVVGGRLHAQKGIEAGVAGDLNGHRTTLGAGIDPMKNLQEAKLEARIRQAEAVETKVGKMKELVSPERLEEIDELISKESTKRKESASELDRLQEEGVNLGECMIKIRKEAHPGVRIQIGRGELAIDDEYRSATFHYDQESGEVVGLFGSGGDK